MESLVTVIINSFNSFAGLSGKLNHVFLFSGNVEVIDLDNPVTRSDSFPASWVYSLGILLLLLVIVIFLLRKSSRDLKLDFEELKKNQKRLQKINDDLKRQLSKLSIPKAKPVQEQPEFFDATSGGIVVTDVDGKIISVNNGFKESFGFTKEAFIKKYGDNYKNSSSYPKAIDEAVNTKRNVIFPSLRENVHGERIWINTEVCPILNKQGNIVKLYFFETDVNLYKVIETEIIQQRDEVELEKTKAQMQRNKMQVKFQGFSDSVNYAQRIQKAILPSAETLDEFFEEQFVLYHPRDVVSGDFYWVTEKGSRQIVVVADCTGHGVPGAFMSILGINFLNEIVSKNRKLSAAGILDKLRKLVVDALNSPQDEEGAQDGMDMGVCIFDKEKKVVQYSGANNSIYIIRNQILEIHKGDRMPVGNHPKMDQSFKNNNIQIEKGDSIYLFTDGYIDQFGWRNGKKFKSRPFQDQLLQLQDIPMKGQKIILENTINNWRGDIEQVDDMLVLGLKI